MTSSASAALKGAQEPRFDISPSARWSQADDAAFLAASYGLHPDPWQSLILRSWLAERGDGRWASSRAGLAVPRQNGKNAVLEIRELYGMVALGEKFLHTAHEVKTARKAFLRLAGFFENPRQWPELAGLVESIRKTNGQEAIVLSNGGSVEFVARSRGSGRGYTVDVLVADEAQELSDEQLEALLPTISSAPTGNPQILLTGTPPPPGSTAEVFRRTRADALSDADPRLSWHEWSVGDDFDPDDREVWAATNPALGIRLSVDVIEAERAQLSDDGFARERLGMWDTSKRHAVIAADVWAALADRKSQTDGPVTFAVDVPPERDSASIGVGGYRADGSAHVELAARERGTAWAVDWLAERAKKWKAGVVLDPGSAAGSLIPALMKAGVEPQLVTGRELAQACGALYDAVTAGKLRHLDQADLNTAVDAARRRPVGDAWAWHRRDTASDISPLVAVTLALHGASKPSKKRPKTGRAAFH